MLRAATLCYKARVPLEISLQSFVVKWVELIVTPFQHFGGVWLGIVPLYVSLVLGELYKSKVSFSHAVGNGFVMLWAGLNWAVHLSGIGWPGYVGTGKERMALAWIVTACAIALAIFTIVLGFRKKDKGLCEVLGHTRFSCYFLILLYPMQMRMVPWNWPSLAAVLVFALPCWLLIYLVGRLASRVLR